MGRIEDWVMEFAKVKLGVIQSLHVLGELIVIANYELVPGIKFGVELEMNTR